mmetsp:Transcript_18937/g.38928  ORF Transcript_18937/g.38928 Transcript_18937/m.38928 type:complete len:340 (-) Transcript_18937:814-1833(-)|eukprot:CAMPEP_0168289414 /NCGR_PEP_ID=MMETSP0142_2-20121227/4322_1 /TAXON_ID=44445 /ORGANISM="Pseudo-nitzschia australis, Strain 10249 10 AB" /LENGTH=339 /DNA_ID=CAMNT_0008235965 /DNA_START=88 /DNA_END=1107 /DNA_ORIENTATION=+
METLSFFVTGASSGVGLEATRQLARGLSRQQQQQQQQQPNNTNDNNDKVAPIIYLLCRSEEKAQAAIEDIHKSIGESSSSNSNSIQLTFLEFDAYDDAETIRSSIQLSRATKIGGILLNAGGFGEATTTIDKKNSSSSNIAQLNIIGHVVLVHHLLSVGKTVKSTRIVAAGSEASFVTPGLTIDRYKTADFVAHLSPSMSMSKSNRMAIGTEYAWTKGILALYWAAFARHHPELFVVTVSPGAVSDTQLLSNVPFLLRAVARMSQWSCLGGSHTVQEGAKRYVDALLTATPAESSGDFLASRKGFSQDFGSVGTLAKGRFVTDVELQDKAWEAIQKFIE